MNRIESNLLNKVIEEKMMREMLGDALQSSGVAADVVEAAVEEEVNPSPSAEDAGAVRRSGGDERARDSRAGTRDDVGEMACAGGTPFVWRLLITMVSTSLSCLCTPST